MPITYREFGPNALLLFKSLWCINILVVAVVVVVVDVYVPLLRAHRGNREVRVFQQIPVKIRQEKHRDVKTESTTSSSNKRTKNLYQDNQHCIIKLLCGCLKYVFKRSQF